MRKYWYLFLLAILISTSSAPIEKAMKKWIPDDLKRAKIYQAILFGMTLLYGIVIFFITVGTFSLPLCLFLSGFPLVCVVIGTLIGKHKYK